MCLDQAHTWSVRLVVPPEPTQTPSQRLEPISLGLAQVAEPQTLAAARFTELEEAEPLDILETAESAQTRLWAFKQTVLVGVVAAHKTTAAGTVLVVGASEYKVSGLTVLPM